MNKLENKKIIFFGKITAAMTHEINNILAIIKESSGLMQDIISMARDSDFPYLDKFQSTLAQIDNQVQRGINVTKKLNSFAHSADEPVAKIDLYELTDQIVSLSQRFARLKNVCLKLIPENNENHLLIVSRPVQLQMALFTCIEFFVNILEPGSEIHIRPEKRGDQYAVNISCKGNITNKSGYAQSITSSEKWEELERIVDLLKGKVELDASASDIMLLLPEK